jgi:hypothetical protein
MFDLEKLGALDAALRRIETAPAPLLKDLLREVMDVRQANPAKDSRATARRQESRAA